MKMNLKEILASWNPWHLRKRIAKLEQQRTANYTGLMTECEKLKEENERLTSERVQMLSFFKMNAVVQRHNAQKMVETCDHYQNDKGDAHEQIGN